eukprot:1186227-Prorocentrum_minimum.AAC.2
MWRRATARLSQYMKDVADHRPPEEYSLFSFKSQADCERWEVFTDSQMGGRSAAQLQYDKEGAGRFRPPSVHGDVWSVLVLTIDVVSSVRYDKSAGTAVFSGELSGEKEGVKPGQRILRKTGFCGFRSMLAVDTMFILPYHTPTTHRDQGATRDS